MTSSTELISQSPCSSVAEYWLFKWLAVTQILGLLNSLFPWIYIKLKVILDDGEVSMDLEM